MRSKTVSLERPKLFSALGLKRALLSVVALMVRVNGVMGVLIAVSGCEHLVV